ncbi:MAG: hypothetical protein HY904_16845 [Deltaproteobacteria bacterium]|nr:hypothetical protein [Deltaproteobacteria bacterium]
MASRKSKVPLRGVVKGKNPITVAPSDTELGRMGLLLEHMSDKVDLVHEGMMIIRESLERRIAESKADLSARLDTVESVIRHLSAEVRKNSDDIRKNSDDIRKNSDDIRKSSEAIRRLEQAVDAVRGDLSGKADAADLRRLEERVTALERRLAS